MLRVVRSYRVPVRPAVPVILALAAALLPLASVEAVPRYSTRYGQDCSLCHVNPTGGGQRTLFGAQFFAYTDLAIQRLTMSEIEAVKPMLNDQVQIGFDVRTLYYGTDEPAYNTFLEMQGDLYLSVQLSPRWTVMLDKGLRGGFEAMAIGHVLPANGYVKVGEFVPPYGMRLADHKAFVRERLGFDFSWREAGIEIGFHPERFSAAVAVTNGNLGLVDTNEEKAVTARADIRWSFGDLRTWLGATGRTNEGPGTPDDRVGGGYAGLALGPVTVLGEVGHRWHDRDALTSFIELSLQAMRGVTVRIEHDYHDPDTAVKGGAENLYVAGLEVVPTGYLHLVPNVRFHDRTGDDFIEAEIQLHLFF